MHLPFSISYAISPIGELISMTLYEEIGLSKDEMSGQIFTWHVVSSTIG